MSILALAVFLGLPTAQDQWINIIKQASEAFARFRLAANF